MNQRFPCSLFRFKSSFFSSVSRTFSKTDETDLHPFRSVDKAVDLRDRGPRFEFRRGHCSRPLLSNSGELKLWAAGLACRGSIDGRNSHGSGPGTPRRRSSGCCVSGSHRDPRIWEEREKNEQLPGSHGETHSNRPFSSVVKAVDLRDRGPRFESRRGQNLQSTVTEQLRGTGALGGKPSVPGINKWPQLSW